MKAPASVDVVINPLSGGVSGHEPARIRQIVQEQGCHVCAMHVLREEDIAALAELPLQGEAVVALGGDGTLKTLLDVADRPVLPLPGGTMNMLAQAVLGEGDWEALLKQALQRPRLGRLAAGDLSGRRFYVAALLGPAAHWARARESVRRGLVRDTVVRLRRAVSVLKHGRLAYLVPQSEAEWAEARELLLMTSAASPRLPAEGPLEGIAIENHSVRALARLGLATLATGWQDTQDVAGFRIASLEVRAHHRIPCLLDGEFTRLPRRVKLRFLPEAAQVWSIAP